MEWNFGAITDQERLDAPRPKDEEVKIPITPVPPTAPDMDFRHPVYGAPVETYAYHQADGQLFAYMGRFHDEEGHKHTYPLTFCQVGAQQVWRAEGFPAPSPLHNLSEILARPDAPVLVVRGERNVLVARDLFPGFVATTSASDDGQIYKADWSPMARRVVVVTAHADDREKSYYSAVADHAYRAGAKAVHILPSRTLSRFFWGETGKVHRASVPTGWDIATAVIEGWTAETAAQEIGDISALKLMPKPLVMDQRGKALFRLAPGGLEALIEKFGPSGEIKSSKWVHICGPIELIAEGRTPDKTGWAKVFRITNRDGEQIEVELPADLLAGDGVKLRERLHDLGLYMSTSRDAREMVLEYVSRAETKNRFLRVERTGWFDNVFVTSTGIIGRHQSGEDVRFTGKGHTLMGQVGGSFEAWQNEVARPSQGNSRLVFAIAMAFAAPLLKFVKSESVIFHLLGQSSKGKTITLTVAGSVFGGDGHKPNIDTWRTTSNALEYRCMGHNDTLLCQDELGQFSSKELGGTVYMVGGGRGKGRSKSGGGLQLTPTWGLICLSTGEVGLETKMRELNSDAQTNAGQEVRLIELPADAGKNMGVFETIDGFASAGDKAKSLHVAAVTNYGHAGRAFIDHVINHQPTIADEIEQDSKLFIASLALPKNADGQVMRVAQKFALVAAGGEMAIRANVVPWPKGEALQAAKHLFDDWLSTRGGTSALEEERVLDHIRYMAAKSIYSLMKGTEAEMSSSAVATAGLVKEIDSERLICIPPIVWKRDWCQGFSPRFVTQLLKSKGYLSCDKDRLDKTIKYGKKSIKVYAIKESLLTEPSPKPSARLSPLFASRMSVQSH